MDVQTHRVGHLQRRRHPEVVDAGHSDACHSGIGGMDRPVGRSGLGAQSGHGNASSIFVTIVNRVASWVIGSICSLMISALMYDQFSPVYRDVSLSNVRTSGSTVWGSLKLTKTRGCKVEAGSLAAFAHFQDVREPVLYVNSSGVPLKLRDLPVSDVPYMLDVGWQLDNIHPLPDAVSVSFRGDCGFWSKRLVIGPLPTGLKPSEY